MTTISLGATPAGKPLHLPLDIATESVAIVARKGRGKSYTARVMVESLIANHVQIVVADPTDVWWGIRAAKDGKGPGCNVVVFGGQHADLPLTESSGKILADTVVDHGLSVILVTAHLSKASSRRFLADFAERLYERKHEDRHKTAMTLVVDEADIFAPQQMTPEAARCAGVLDECARRGRVRGIGVLAITQRPAVLNKNILSQTEVLICLQVTGPQDRKALSEWTDANADVDQSRLFLSTLAKLQRGEAWVWSPAADLFVRIQVGQIKTYDSMSTPKVGEVRAAAPALRKVDLEKLKADLAETIAKAEADDPTKLRSEIARLKRELAAKPKAEIDQSGVDAAVMRAEKRWLAVREHELRSLRQTVSGAVTKAFESFTVPTVLRHAADPRLYAAPLPTQSIAPGVLAMPKLVTTRPALTATGDENPLSRPERAILTAIVQNHPRTSTRAQMSIISGYSITSSSFANALGALRSRRFIEGPGDDTQVTDAGLAACGSVETRPKGHELVRWWCAKLNKAERTMLETIVGSYPQPIDKDTLSQVSGYSVTSSSFANALGALRTLCLIDRGPIRASDDLMES